MDFLYAACILVQICAVAFAAPSLAPPSLSLLVSPNINFTVPFSATQPFPSNRLPSDPFVYHAPDSDETVRFYSYGISLPRKDVTHAIVFATRAIAMHGSSEEGISDRIIRYGSNDVYLLMHHSGRMTWTMWETALRGIVDFLERYEYVEVEFDIGQTGLEQFLGTGVLGMKKG